MTSPDNRLPTKPLAAITVAVLLLGCSKSNEGVSEVCVKLPTTDVPVRRRITHPGHSRWPSRLYEKKYAFTSDWFTGSVPVFRKVLKPLAGKPELRYLEIGVYEGRSLLWVLENILTHPTSRAAVIDFFFFPPTKRRLLENLKLHGDPAKVTIHEGLSETVLPRLRRNYYDLIYIDGSHAAEDVLFDALYSWRLLKVGGLLILDDYGMTPERSAENRPMVAIDAFITAHRNSLEIVHHAFIVVVRKIKAPPCDYKRRCSRVGDYVYDWDRKRLVNLKTKKSVAMTDRELSIVRRLLNARRFGAASNQFYAEDLASIRKEPEFDKVNRLLQLKIETGGARAK